MRPFWISFGITLLILCFLEGAARIVFWDELTRSPMRDHARLGWEPRPNFHSDPAYRTNADGFYNDPFPAQRSEDLRILVLGDSISAGMDTYPSDLQELLNQRFSPSRFLVINGAVGGYGTEQEKEVLRLKGIALKPDWVLLQFFFLNDMEDTLLFEPRSWLRQRLRVLTLYRLAGKLRTQWNLQAELAERLDAAAAEGVEPRDKSQLTRYRYTRKLLGDARMVRAWEKTGRVFSEIVRLARSNGIRPFVLLTHRGHPEDEQALALLTQEHDVPVIDLSSMGEREEILQDAIHFNKAGHKELSRRLADALQPWILSDLGLPDPAQTNAEGS